MPRPCKLRRVMCDPDAVSFKPCGIPLRDLEAVSLTLDELEAIRLADLEGLYQEDAAQRMRISRQTFGNIVSSAHRKVADFLVNSKNLTVEGGVVVMRERSFTCGQCGHVWPVAFGTGRPCECPQCKNANVQRSEDQRCVGRRAGQGRGHGSCCRGSK
ncbi:MAG: DUF134 domain-containing protein [Candidatus Eisenbacteria bacterium]|nr:DUF134 domain-containing protein [Candidatus Eisenbacteria bacterium]